MFFRSRTKPARAHSWVCEHGLWCKYDCKSGLYQTDVNL